MKNVTTHTFSQVRDAKAKTTSDKKEKKKGEATVPPLAPKKKCAVRESNPGHLDGNEVLCH